MNIGYTLKIIFGLAIVSVFFLTLRFIMLLFANMKVGRWLHSDMLNKVMNAPINLFFDVTPIGKILNRFSKDISCVDTELPFFVNGLIATVAHASQAIILAFIASLWLIAPILVVIYLAFRLFKYSIKSQKDTHRIESVTRTPAISFLSETF